MTVGAGGGSVAWVSPEGSLKVGPRSAGADPGPLCYGRGGADVTVTDAHVVLGRIPPHLLGGEIPLDVAAARAGLASLTATLGLELERCASGVLEISAWNQANALRQITVKRGLDVRDFTMATFGGSGPLLLCRLIDILGLREVLVPRDPGNVSAFGLLSVDVKNDYVRTSVCRHAELDLPATAEIFNQLRAEGAQALHREGFPESEHRFVRTADLRYLGQAFEVRVDVRTARWTRRWRPRWPKRFTRRTNRCMATGFEATRASRWSGLTIGFRRSVQLRVRFCPSCRWGTVVPHALRPAYGRCSSILGLAPRSMPGPNCCRETSCPGLRSSRSSVRRFRCTLVSAPRLISSEMCWCAVNIDPVLLEIVEGTLASVEREVETAIARTSRSPMIRDAHDFRAGIHDRRLRKLTGRSYSALMQPIVRDFPIVTMRPGDVFFHNDVYLSEGGIGHLPDLCVTVPVFADDAPHPPRGDQATSHQSEVVAFMQAFGHHDDIGGAVPGSMPSHATSVFEEGLMVPPIRLYDAGVPNVAALRIMTRNSRMPDSLAADLDAECSACLMGARRLGELFTRYGREAVEGCFDALIDATTETYRREIVAKIPDGVYVWEDYAEHDGVDPPRLHAQRITLSVDNSARRPLVIDFTGTGPQARGPINHCGDYADGNFLIKWLAPVLRNLADTPERMAQLDVNEGVVPLIEMRFPSPGTLLTPVSPAPTNARTFVILRLLGVLIGALAKAVDGRMPADQETIRYTGVYGNDARGEPYLMREVLGGGSGGRYYADGEDTIHVVPDSRNLPSEFTESRFPFLVERLGLAIDSGGAGRFRGGLGYDKWLRTTRDAHFMSIADRSILSCWGLRGGKAGQPFSVVIDPGGPGEREVEALADAEPVRAGEVIRIRTTGGGGWGDPLERPYEEVARDVRWGKVSVAGALADYGVVVSGAVMEGAGLGEPMDDPVVDVAASDQERAQRLTARAARIAATGPEPFFDRGPGYARLSGGTPHNHLDWLGPRDR